jgi:hypothetical protein
VSKVPSQTRAAFCGSRISAAHFPHGRCLTPRYLRFLAGGGNNGATVSAGSEDGPPPSGVGVGVALAHSRVCTASAQQKHHQFQSAPKHHLIIISCGYVCTSAEPSEKRLARKLTCETSKATKTSTLVLNLPKCLQGNLACELSNYSRAQKTPPCEAMADPPFTSAKFHSCRSLYRNFRPRCFHKEMTRK